MHTAGFSQFVSCLSTGYISALSNWDDVASAVRRTGQADGRRKVPAVWGNQWGLPGTWALPPLLSQTSDVVWVEGTPSDNGASAWPEPPALPAVRLAAACVGGA